MKGDTIFNESSQYLMSQNYFTIYLNLGFKTISINKKTKNLQLNCIILIIQIRNFLYTKDNKY